MVLETAYITVLSCPCNDLPCYGALGIVRVIREIVFAAQAITAVATHFAVTWSVCLLSVVCLLLRPA